MRRRELIVAGSGSSSSDCSSASSVALSAVAAPRFSAPGDYDLALKVAGQSRTFLVRLPPRYAARGPLPVLIAFHGGGGNASGFKAYAELDAVADREGIVAVYPDGSGRLGRRLLTWNAGSCCGYARDSGVDDVGFAVAVLRDLAGDLPLDGTRVYATGHSNGAMMAYRLAIEASERIAAIAPVAGMMVADRFPPARPVPVLHIHSVDDPRALYAGGVGPAFPGTTITVTHRPVESQLARWVAHDGCPAEPTVADRRRVTARGGEQTATLLRPRAVRHRRAGRAVASHRRRPRLARRSRRASRADHGTRDDRHRCRGRDVAVRLALPSDRRSAAAVASGAWPTPDLLDALEIESAPSPTAAVIWLHGLGADGHDFVDIVPMLGLPGDSRPASCSRTRRCGR